MWDMGRDSHSLRQASVIVSKEHAQLVLTEHASIQLVVGFFLILSTSQGCDTHNGMGWFQSILPHCLIKGLHLHVQA